MSVLISQVLIFSIHILWEPEKVKEEIKQNSKVKFKESDLFRVYQSMDLGNLDSLQASNENSEMNVISKSLPMLRQLQQILYSSEWRARMEQWTNLCPGTLTTRVDCAANCHAPGCHLLCHDDVIGTRKISFILYLTDDEEWKSNEGGALELYASDSDGNPEAIPSTSLLPQWNSLAFFEVKPGVSFHAVQEVFGERPRLSIQGWYHAANPPENTEAATLSRLKTLEDVGEAYNDFPVGEEKNEDYTELSDEDRTFLKKFINETYLSSESIQEIREQFENDSSVQLRKFLAPSLLSQIQKISSVEDDGGQDKAILKYDEFATHGWKILGPAHKQRFLIYEGTSKTNSKSGVDNSAMGEILRQIKEDLFQTSAFGRFLMLVTSLGIPTGYRGRIRRFRPGLDYTVAHYGSLTIENSVLDATLCFCDGSGEQPKIDEETGELTGSDSDAIWASGDCGGFECYIAAEDEDDDDENDNDQHSADDEYKEDADTELLSVSACNNTLSLVFRDPGTMRFIKYVGKQAPSSRWDVSMEYAVEETIEEIISEEESDSNNE
jgi:prolyl 3-hydroxylase /prolyl 3,4-dihydroxylase